jgi:uncharacterized protein involved in exopolysaccharide biosynthesis
MKFDELQKVLNENFNTEKLSDIAHELGVTPQVVNGWKSRNQVPYKYVKIVRDRVSKITKRPQRQQSINSPMSGLHDFAEHGDDDGFEMFFDYLKLLKINYKIIVRASIIAVVLAFLYEIFIKEPIHIARARILPVASSSSNGIGGIASQFGININSGDESSLLDAELYPEIIKSRRLARKLLRTKFSVKKRDNQSYPLVKILADDFSDSLISKNEIKAYTGKLLTMIKVNVTPTKLLKLEIGTTDLELSKRLMEAIILNLEELLLSFKDSETTEKKEFVLKRISALEAELILSEDRLKNFREQNRKISFSPALLLEEERFIRIIDVKKQLYITLKSQIEMIQIDENNNKSMIQILDPPEYFGNYALSLVNILALYLLFGLIISIAIIIAIDWYRKNKFYFIR